MSAEDKDRIARDVENLVEIFNRSDWQEMHLKTDDVEIFLSNDPKASLATVTAATAAPSPAPAAAPQPGQIQGEEPTADANVAASSVSVTVPDGMIAVTAPNLGTFYRAPKPGAAPYVEVGQTVSDTTDVCLIEVMKLFTPVKAGVSGTVHEVCVADGTMVEFGDILVIIDPS